jgi:hypothetical protein
VYDSVAGSVRFYLNGRLDSETLLRTAWRNRLGPAQVGSWNRSNRRLSGRMDELVVLGRALNAVEICELHEAPNP